MIQLHSDCLVFKTSTGEAIPCSAELVTVELIGPAVELLDPDIIRNAAAAVLHYFRNELGRESVSVAEFSEALERVLSSFGLSVKHTEVKNQPDDISRTDLRLIACESGKSFELAFFPRLRDELRHRLEGSPRVLQFTGLRGCVKQLVGARRWCPRCQRLNDQIVTYLRQCWQEQPANGECALVVQ